MRILFWDSLHDLSFIVAIAGIVVGSAWLLGFGVVSVVVSNYYFLHSQGEI